MKINKLCITNFLLLFALFLFTQCNKKVWDEFYGRPDGLGAPIYQQLEARGNFKHFLSCVEKADYKKTLSAGGYWTIFPPTDDAFERFFREKGISGIEALSDQDVTAIVRYSLIYNSYQKAQLTTAQTTTGPIPNYSFKRKTAYYDFVHRDPTSGYYIVAANRNDLYSAGDMNNKYIPFFIEDFMQQAGIGSNDYKFFFPNKSYSGFNVVGANVIESDIAAENGMIHIVDEVITPLLSLEDILKSNPDYSDFYALLNKYARYTSDPQLTTLHNVLTGISDSVYVKHYSLIAIQDEFPRAKSLSFFPNNENFSRQGEAYMPTMSQMDGYSMVVPTNAALREAQQEVLKYYGSFDNAPRTILLDFLRGHMWGSTLWPSKFEQTNNVAGETATITPSDVVDGRLASNGVFYGANKAHLSNVFTTTYSRAYIDPRYTMMKNALEDEVIFTVNIPAIPNSMFMMSNVALAAEGINFNQGRVISGDPWGYTAPGASTAYGAASKEKVMRMLQTSVTNPERNSYLTENEVRNGSGVYEAYNGEYVRYENGKVWASGNVEIDEKVTITEVALQKNGTVFYLDGILKPSESPIGIHLALLKEKEAGTFSHFINYVQNSTVYSLLNQSIAGMQNGVFYTLFIPTNEAIERAVKDGVLPGNVTTGVPNFTPAEQFQTDVARFILYHILARTAMTADGRKLSRDYPTLDINNLAIPNEIYVLNQLNNMIVSDKSGNTANVILSKSNHLANRTLIHAIDNYLLPADQ